MVQAACRDVTEHMERVHGAEPPLPLGGDVMAHPGWRDPSRPQPPFTPPIAPEPGRMGTAIFIAAMDELVVRRGEPEELVRQLGEVVGRWGRGTDA